MQTLYTDEIKDMVRSVEWKAKGFFLDVIEYHSPVPYLTLVVRPSNFNQFSIQDRIRLAEKVNALCARIVEKGCPCYVEFWE